MPRAGQRMPMKQRIRSRIVVTEAGCWQWQGNTARDGYGRVEVREGVGRATRRYRVAHRVSYEAFVGPVPDGLVLDHLCRNRGCVNPEHLEPVPSRVNTLRGISPAAENFVKKVCHRGHPLAGDNLRIREDGTRRCRTCIRETGRLAYARKKTTRIGGAA